MSKPEQSANPANAKDAALAQADALAGNEAGVAEFIQQCPYPDARFKAAHYLHSKSLLEQVVQAMRNTDRRVTKLLQKRLDQILAQEKAEQQATECIRQAQQLLDAPAVTPNQVADLDRAWTLAGPVAPPLCDAFDSARTALSKRLEAQAALQRAAIDVRTKLHKLTRATVEAPHMFTREKLLQSLESLEQEMARYRVDREAPSLPQSLLADFAKLQDQFLQTLAMMDARNTAIETRAAALANWEGAPAIELKQETVQRAWNALPPVPGGDATLEARLDALLARIAEAHKQQPRNVPAAPEQQLREFGEALDKMERALENGALQEASDQDKVLRSLDPNKLALPEEHAARLAKVRAELRRLQGWARWGGNISREELLKAAEELPAKQHPIPELAKRVGSLRERWKSLDASAGPANKEMWERFDAACTNAYAPVAAHSRQLAQERQNNLQQAQNLIAELRQFIADSGCATAQAEQVDWRALAAFQSRMLQAWQRVGPIDRKERKLLDAEFKQAMHILSEPLAAQRKAEIAEREKLIEEAGALNPAERRAADALRVLQERWQERAKALPLARKDEQALWQRFRAACDAFFAKRKEVSQSADAERQHHLRAKEVLCSALEEFAEQPAEAIEKRLREAAMQWSKVGPVPRGAEQAIEQRYQAALAALQQRLEQVQSAAHQVQAAAMLDKLILCQAVEQSIASSQAADERQIAQWQASWQALPSLPQKSEHVLKARFDDAINAAKSTDARYADLLRRNRADLERQVLRLEIMMGIDSPPELSHERLQLQVEVLQSSLKNGLKPLSLQDQLRQIIGLPASTDELLTRRIATIGERLAKSRQPG